MNTFADPSALQVVRFCKLETLAPLAAEWDRLSGGVPFRCWAWASCWWRHYGESHRQPRGVSNDLYVLGVFDSSGRLAGIAPWHLEASAGRGRVLRSLGSGEVCSEYPSLLCELGREAVVAGAVADWLTAAAEADSLPGLQSDRWDLLELTAVDAEDGAMARLAERLEARGNTIHRRPGAACWRLGLPPTWEQYQAQFSPKRRARLRKIEKVLYGPRATVHWVDSAEELPRTEEILVDLHQRRRRQRGEPGIFASTRFADFHHEVLPKFRAEGRLLLGRIELDGRPVAAEYALTGGGRVYSYQSGIEPSRLADSPGHLGNYALVRRAIECGGRTLDFLRGDEPYKAEWGARPHPTVEIRAVPDRQAARWRHRLWLAGTGVKRWIKRRIVR